MKKILTTTGLFLTLISCGESNVQNEQKTKPIKRIAGWEIVKQDDYSIQYPKSWELNQGGQMGTQFILFSAMENGEDQFRENVNLIVQDLNNSAVDLDAFAEISLKQVESMLTNCEVVENKRLKNGRRAYHKLIYSADQGMLNLKFEQYFWVENEKAYVLTLTCEKSKFATFQKIGEQILNSFSFTKG